MTREQAIAAAEEAAAHILEEADFNMSWTDGRRGSRFDGAEYRETRIAAAKQREKWAAAIKFLMSNALEHA